MLLLRPGDAGLGLGVHDPGGAWPGLAFSTTDYREGRRVVSFRAGSALSESAAVDMVFPGASLGASFADLGAPPFADFAYPLLATDELGGRLVVVHPSRAELNALAKGLTGLGFGVVVARPPSLLSDVSRSPLVWVMALLCVFAVVSAHLACSVQQTGLRDRFRRDVLLGATYLRSVLPKLGIVVGGWGLAALASSAVGGIVAFVVLRVPLPPAYVAGWVIFLLVGLLVSSGVFAVAGARQGRVVA